MHIVFSESAHLLGGLRGCSLEATTPTEVSLRLVVLLESPQARVPEMTSWLYLLPASDFFTLQSLLPGLQVQKKHLSVEAQNSAQAWALSLNVVAMLAFGSEKPICFSMMQPDNIQSVPKKDREECFSSQVVQEEDITVNIQKATTSGQQIFISRNMAV